MAVLDYISNGSLALTSEKIECLGDLWTLSSKDVTTASPLGFLSVTPMPCPKECGLLLHPLGSGLIHDCFDQWPWQSDPASVLGMALSQPGSFCLLPLGASCRVRSVTVLRLAEDVPHRETERPRRERCTGCHMKKPCWKGIFQLQLPDFPTKFPNSQPTESWKK